MNKTAANATGRTAPSGNSSWPGFPASIGTLGFIRRLIIAFGLMVFIPLLVMVYVHISRDKVSFPLVLISTAAASTVGFWVVWEMVTRVTALLRELKPVGAQEAPVDTAGDEQSISEMIHRMQVNMAELETKARQLDEAERRLGEANIYSAQIIASIADFVFVTTPQLHVTKINAAIQTALGYGADELSGCAIETVLRGTDGGDVLFTRQEMEQLAKSGTLWGKSGMLRSRDGEGIPVQMNVSPVSDGGGRLSGIVIVARDVRETLRLVADLRQAKATLEGQVKQRTLEIEGAHREREQAALELTRRGDQLSQQEKMASFGQLAAGVAREIAEPVEEVSRHLQGVASRLADATHDVARGGALIARVAGGDPSATAGHAQDLVRWSQEARLAHTLDASRQSVVESIGGLDRVKKIVSALQGFSDADRDVATWADLNEGLENTINVIGSELKRNVSLHREYGDIPKVLCYPRQLNQVFLIVLVKAAQGISERGDMWVRTWADADTVYVEVREAGSGSSGDHPSKSVGQDAGRGFDVASEILDRHGGALRVTGRVGEGATVHLSVPIKRFVRLAA